MLFSNYRLQCKGEFTLIFKIKKTCEKGNIAFWMVL